MSKNAKNSAIKVIAHCIEKDESGIRNLLKRNGVDTSLIVGRNKLTKVFVDALAKSKRLGVEFIQYVNRKKEGYNASGREPVSTVSVLQPTGLESLSIPTQTTQASTTNNNSSGGGFFSGITLAELINTGVGVLEIQRDIEVSRNEKDAVTSAVNAERDRVKLQPQSGSNNNVLIGTVAVVGLVAVGTLVYFISKKK